MTRVQQPANRKNCGGSFDLTLRKFLRGGGIPFSVKRLPSPR